MMTPEELKKIGQKRFGNRWKSPLAKELGVTRDTVYRWASGKKPISSLAEKALSLLEQQTIRIPYREKRHRAYGETKTLSGARLIHGDARQVMLNQSVDVILTDPVWPNAVESLSGAHDPYDLFAASITNLIPFLSPSGRLIIQMRCDSDPRILSCIPKSFPFLRSVWLPYAIPSRQGRILISGDIGYIFGIAPQTRPGNHVLPGQPHSDFCPPAQPNKCNHQHPCPRHLAHVEWLVG